MLKEFRQFVMRGNVVDLAVAVVIGVAFGAVVTALVADLITPLVAAIFGKPSFANLSFEINKSTFLYGASTPCSRFSSSPRRSSSSW